MLSRQSATPLYEQLKQQLLEQIASGSLAQHSQLPSERRLVEELGVSRITVRKALSDLVQHGHLYTVPGKGFFVGNGEAALDTPYELNALLSFSAAARARGVVPTSRVLDAAVVPAPASVVFQLQLAAGEPVALLRRVRLLDDEPAMVQESWLPHAICPGLLAGDLTQLSLYTVLTERYGIQLGRGHTVISARLASADEREWLALPEPAALLTVDQLTFNREGRPVELSHSLYDPERYPLSIVHGDAAPTRGMATGPPSRPQAARA